MSWLFWGGDEAEDGGKDWRVCDPCPECGGSLPCYGWGLEREAMGKLAQRDAREAQRRIAWHVRIAVCEAGPGGISEAALARKLGIDSGGCDEGVRIVERRGVES